MLDVAQYLECVIYVSRSSHFVSSEQSKFKLIWLSSRRENKLLLFIYNRGKLTQSLTLHDNQVTLCLSRSSVTSVFTMDPFGTLHQSTTITFD